MSQSTRESGQAISGAVDAMEKEKFNQRERYDLTRTPNEVQRTSDTEITWRVDSEVFCMCIIDLNFNCHHARVHVGARAAQAWARHYNLCKRYIPL